VSPVGTMPPDVWPHDTSGEPIIVGDDQGAVMSLLPPPIAAQGSAEWTGQFQVPEPQPGESRPREMTVEAHWMSEQMGECLAAVSEDIAVSAISEGIRRAFGSCVADASEAIYNGRTAIVETHNRRDRFMNDLGFIVSVVKAMASCSAFMPVRIAIEMARLQEAAEGAAGILSNGNIVAKCGAPLGAALGAALGYSFDPNEIVGPAGGGSRNAIAVADSLVYTVLFENAPRPLPRRRMLGSRYPWTRARSTLTWCAPSRSGSVRKP